MFVTEFYKQKIQRKTSSNTETEGNEVKDGHREIILACGQLDESDVQ